MTTKPKTHKPAPKASAPKPAPKQDLPAPGAANEMCALIARWHFLCADAKWRHEAFKSESELRLITSCGHTRKRRPK